MAKHRTNDEIRKELAAKMVTAIEAGTPPWRRPWRFLTNTGMPRNFHSHRRYNGINVLWLWLLGECYDWYSFNWGTSKSWLKEVGGHVRKGEHASEVLFWNVRPKIDPATKQPMKDKHQRDVMIWSLRTYNVFNVDQIQAPSEQTLLVNRTGLVCSLLGENVRPQDKPTTKADLVAIAARYLPHDAQPNARATRQEIAYQINQGIERRLATYRATVVPQNNDPDFEPAERLMRTCGATIKHGGNKAVYRVHADSVTLPAKRSFTTIADYYQTAMHELIHWVRRPKRAGIGEAETYAFGELVAELGSCFLLSELGLPLAPQMIEKSQSYLAEWLSQTKEDPKYIFQAATEASKAADWLLTTIGLGNPKDEPVERGGAGLSRDVA